MRAVSASANGFGRAFVLAGGILNESIYLLFLLYERELFIINTNNIGGGSFWRVLGTAFCLKSG